MSKKLSPNEVRMELYIARKTFDKARALVEYWEREAKLIDYGCEYCDHFRNEVCHLAGGVRPPDSVIEKGCPEWISDGIPF